MRVTFWINTGFAGCDYEETMEFDNNTTGEKLEEEAKTFLTNNIEFGWYKVEE